MRAICKQLFAGLLTLAVLWQSVVPCSCAHCDFPEHSCCNGRECESCGRCHDGNCCHPQHEHESAEPTDSDTLFACAHQSHGGSRPEESESTCSRLRVFVPSQGPLLQLLGVIWCRPSLFADTDLSVLGREGASWRAALESCISESAQLIRSVRLQV